MLLARLVEQGRALAKAELALFRTDFYRRIGRARTGALLCLVGAIMGQAAAVTFLVTLSFLLAPFIGRLGGAAVSVLFGLAMAVILIRIGVRKLVLVMDDDDEDEDLHRPRGGTSPVDELFEKVRQRSQMARNDLIETVGETQARLHPQALIADLVDMVADHAQAMAHRAVEAVRQRPVRATVAAIAVFLVLIRPPIFAAAARLARATRRGAASFTASPAEAPAKRQDEEISS